MMISHNWNMKQENTVLRNRKDSTIKKTGKELIRDSNEGSIIIEMCFIAPLLAGIIFFCINLFIVGMNKSIAMGETYNALYTKETYILDAEQNYKSDIKNEIENNVYQMMKLVESITVEVKENKKNSTIINNLKTFDEGEFSIKVSYENILKGVIMSEDKVYEDKYEAKQEIRDTSNNLRRWQIYGNELSD